MKSSSNSSKPGSLGQLLHGLRSLAETDRVHLIERAAEDKAFTAALIRIQVERFFEDAKAMITHYLHRGVIVDRIPVRDHYPSRGLNPSATAEALESWRWTHRATEVPADNPHRDLWDRFVQWAQSQELDVSMEADHDGMGQESWPTIVIVPLVRKFNPKPPMAREVVVVPKDKVEEFGSAQAYLDHLVSARGRYP